MIRKMLLLSAAGVALLVYGCGNHGATEGGGGGPGPTPTPIQTPTPTSKTFTTSNYGGRAIIEGGPGGTAVDGFFLTSITPEPTLTFHLGDGVCVVESTAGSATTWTSGDAGTSLSFGLGSTILVAQETTAGGVIEYPYFTPTSLSSSQQGTSWSVVAAGGSFVPAGTLGSIRLPEALQVTYPMLNAGQPATFSWTPAGADTLEIFVSRDRYTRAACYPPDTGSFTVPGAITALAGTSGNLFALRANVDRVTVGGRDVLLEGDSD